MKATIHFDDALYRRLKVEAARRGRTIRDLVDEGVRTILGMAPVSPGTPDESSATEWFGGLRDYASNAAGKHDLASMRRSVVKGREKKT